MFLNKNFQNLNLKSVSKNSDSFDDRFCDDLCEDILQYLPLKHKLRLECVSKQFQRTVFQKQFTITLFSHLLSNHKISQQMKDKVFERHYLKSIESIMKKCPNLKILFLVRIYSRIFKSILPLIIKYCHNLIDFSVFIHPWSVSELNEEFLQKFGSKLKYIRCGQDIDFSMFPNVYTLDKYGMFDSYISRFPEYILPLNLKNLKELNLFLYEENIHLFREVLQKFHKIRHLGLHLCNDVQNLAFYALKESPVLQNLIKLRYDTNRWGSTQYANLSLDSLK